MLPFGNMWSFFKMRFHALKYLEQKKGCNGIHPSKTKVHISDFVVANSLNTSL